MSEKGKNTAIENLEQQKEKAEVLERAGQVGRAELEKQLERNAEKSGEQNPDEARHEIERIAIEAEKTQEKEQHASVEKVEQKPITKRDIEEKYQETMKHMRSQLPAPSRAFSKVIHNPIVEKTSDVIGNTVARPNLIIAGSLGAIASVVVYVLARTYGYELSGFETIGLFLLGWLIGAIFEYARVGFLNNKS